MTETNIMEIDVFISSTKCVSKYRDNQIQQKRYLSLFGMSLKDDVICDILQTLLIIYTSLNKKG